MQRPPYVPKLHSSQIRTRVSGRTYESQTGLNLQMLERDEQRPEIRKVVVACVPTIFHHISRKVGRWLWVVCQKGSVVRWGAGLSAADLCRVGVCTL